jgi:hypothetical protein
LTLFHFCFLCMLKLGSFCSAAFTIENRTNFDHCFFLVPNNLGSCVLNTRVLGDSQSWRRRKAPWMEAERCPSGLDWRHRSPDHRSLELLYCTRYTDCTLSKTISSRMKCYICHGCKRTLPLLDALLFVLLLSLLFELTQLVICYFFFQVAKFELGSCWHQILQFWFVFWSLLNLEWLCREGGRPTTNHHCGNQGTSLCFQSKKNIYILRWFIHWFHGVLAAVLRI